MSDSLVKSLVVFPVSFLLFLLIRKRLNFGCKNDRELKRAKIQKPIVDEAQIQGNKNAENGIVALEAYIEAWNSGESEESLDELNNELKNRFSVFVDKVGDTLIVKTKSGSKILEHKC